MGLPAVTFEDYKRYGSKADEASFKASLSHAVAAVRDIIGFNEPIDEEEREAYIAAVCAAIDVDLLHGGSGGIGEGGNSVNIGSYSTSYSSTSSASRRGGYDEDMRRAIKPHLIGTGLLYQVIR